MELLDLLEQRVGALLDEVASLREENRRLREDVTVGQHRVEEIHVLQDELAREKQIREQALTRVDALLNRIQNSLGDGPEDNLFVSVASRDPDFEENELFDHGADSVNSMDVEGDTATFISGDKTASDATELFTGLSSGECSEPIGDDRTRA